MIEVELIEKNETIRKYKINYRKDRRFSWEYHSVSFIKKNSGEWDFNLDGYYHRSISRYVIIKIENILRGLNS